MEEKKNVALFDHQECKSRFFARIESSAALRYRGRCPNPACNKKVSLKAEEMYVSTDKARRKYIRLSNHPKNQIYWQT